jgi:pimeloyl-ACP methyl ester carboxylesterase
MPYADSQGVRIHYQTVGTGPPIVLQHGFSESIEDWFDCGYVDALKLDYRLILVDARGHGGSDKPHDPRACSKTGSATLPWFSMLLESRRPCFGVIRWAGGSASEWPNMPR